MKIQQVQNNNTNFQGLYGNKWAINGLNQQMKTNEAKNRTIKGRVSTCEFCGQKI